MKKKERIKQRDDAMGRQVCLTMPFIVFVIVRSSVVTMNQDHYLSKLPYLIPQSLTAFKISL